MKIGEPEESPERQKAIDEARFCLSAFGWVILIGILYAFARNALGDSFLDDLSVKVSVLIFQCCLNLTGLWHGIRACRKVSRLGRERILVRAVIGIVFNSLFLLYCVATVLYIIGVIHGAGMLF